jgi:hypothetical protein
MPDHRRKKCRECNKSWHDVGLLSWTGLCVPCAKQRVEHNLDGLLTHSGPELHRWRQGVAASVGAVLLDEPRDAT